MTPLDSVGLRWEDKGHGISKSSIVPGFISLWILGCSLGWMVRINAKEVKKTYPTEEEAKTVAALAAKKLVLAAVKELGLEKEIAEKYNSVDQCR